MPPFATMHAIRPYGTIITAYRHLLVTVDAGGGWIPVMCRCALLLLTLVAIGCDKPKGEGRYAVTTTTTRPTTSDDARGTATTLPATRPLASSLFIGEKMVAFPRARLLLQETQPQVTLLLFSDDPRNALDADYAGNRYYLQIQLDIDDIANLASTDWHFKAASMDRDDSPNGVFLEGDKQHLQPYDVTIVFAQVGPQIGMTIDGQFLAFMNRPAEAGPPRAVLVQGSLLAELETPRKLRKTDLRGETGRR